ncbi:hypothetical protein ACWD1Y_34500 [Streptomyces sp. NPDC002814]
MSVVLSLAHAQNSASPEGRSIDWPRQITAALGLFALMYAVIQGPESGWGSSQIVSAFIVAAVFLVLFVFAESRAAEPLLVLSVFRNRAFAMNSVVTLIGMFAFLVIMYGTSIRLTTIQGFSPLKSSVAYLFFGGIGFALLPLTSKLLERFNPPVGSLHSPDPHRRRRAVVRRRSDERSGPERHRRATDSRRRRLGTGLRLHHRGRGQHVAQPPRRYGERCHDDSVVKIVA